MFTSSCRVHAAPDVFATWRCLSLSKSVSKITELTHERTRTRLTRWKSVLDQRKLSSQMKRPPPSIPPKKRTPPPRLEGRQGWFARRHHTIQPLRSGLPKKAAEPPATGTKAKVWQRGHVVSLMFAGHPQLLLRAWALSRTTTWATFHALKLTIVNVRRTDRRNRASGHIQTG